MQHWMVRLSICLSVRTNTSSHHIYQCISNLIIDLGSLSYHRYSKINLGWIGGVTEMFLACKYYSVVPYSIHVCLFVCPSVRTTFLNLYIHLSICLSVRTNTFFKSLCPFVCLFVDPNILFDHIIHLPLPKGEGNAAKGGDFASVSIIQHIIE